MKFIEAMELLKSGSKVTREAWKNKVYFVMKGCEVKSFQPKLAHYVFNEDIMISDEWVIDGHTKDYKFTEIIPLLQNGCKATRKDWQEAYIYLDRNTKSLVLESMEIFTFIPEFDSFAASDWIEIC